MKSLSNTLLYDRRFDRLLIPLPDLATRELIIRHKLQKRNRQLSNNELRKFAQLTAGMPGGALERVVTMGCHRLDKYSNDSVVKCIEHALDDHIRGGLLQRRINKIQEERIAIHECGHAIVAWFTKEAPPVWRVTINPCTNAPGVTYQVPLQPDLLFQTEGEMKADLKVKFGGTIAEKLSKKADLKVKFGGTIEEKEDKDTSEDTQEHLKVKFGGTIEEKEEKDTSEDMQEHLDISTGICDDLLKATNLAYDMVTLYNMGGEEVNLIGSRSSPHAAVMSDSRKQLIEANVQQLLTTAYTEAENLLKGKMELLKKMSTDLIDKRILSRDDVEKILKKREFSDLYSPDDLYISPNSSLTAV
ncbi:peptidase family m41 domain-containing protein [Ditylenchus destructor]|nr:peptidase family m41 domain-containing protein [Ditylenchus destructor]